LPGAPELKTITESNHIQKQPAGKSEVGDLASCVVESGKEDDDLKPSAENKKMERGSNLKMFEDENSYGYEYNKQ
jgi:gluconate kinase